MSKFFKAEMLPDYSRPFKNWQTDISLAPANKLFLGRIKGTNRHVAVQRDGDKFVAKGLGGIEVDICQWITFEDFADLRACVWRGP